MTPSHKHLASLRNLRGADTALPQAPSVTPSHKHLASLRYLRGLGGGSCRRSRLREYTSLTVCSNGRYRAQSLNQLFFAQPTTTPYLLMHAVLLPPPAGGPPPSRREARCISGSFRDPVPQTPRYGICGELTRRFLRLLPRGSWRRSRLREYTSLTVCSNVRYYK